MKGFHDIQNREKIRAEARAWVISFDRDAPPSEEDVRMLRKWVSQSRAHRVELERSQEMWCDADILSELAVPLAATTQKVGAERFRSTLRYRIGYLSPIFAVLILGVALVFSELFLPVSVGNGGYSTFVGEQEMLVLEDGSEIQLDTGSQIEVVYTDERRVIHLIRGKAHFNVVKNPVRPFEVYAGAGRVRAVGTAFSVSLRDSDVNVMVNEGRVDLARLNPPVAVQGITQSGQEAKPADAGEVFLSLDRGQQALFDQDKEVFSELADFEMSKQMAWRRGILIFSADPLASVVSEVARYTDVNIEISDPELEKLLVGGRFKAGELEPLLDVLEVGFGVRVSYVNRGHIKLSVSD